MVFGEQALALFWLLVASPLSFSEAAVMMALGWQCHLLKWTLGVLVL